MLQTFLALYLHELRVDLARIGMVLAVGPLANLLVALVGGSLADRIGRRPLLIFSIVGSSVILMSFSFVTSLIAFGLLNFLNMGTRSVYRLANSAALADVTPPPMRLEVFGIQKVSMNVGGMLGPLIGYWLFALSPRGSFLMIGLVTLILGVLSLILVPETQPAPVESSADADRAGEAGAWRSIFSDQVLLVFVLCSAGFSGCYRLFDSYLPIIIADQLPDWTIPMIIAVNAMMVICLQMPVNIIARRYRMGTLLFGGGLLFACGWVLFALPMNVVMLLIATFTFTSGELVQSSSQTSFVLAIAPVELRGRYEAFGHLRELGRAVIPMVAGYAMSFAGPSALFVVAGIVSVIASVLGWLADYLAGMRTASTVAR